MKTETTKLNNLAEEMAAYFWGVFMGMDECPENKKVALENISKEFINKARKI